MAKRARRRLCNRLVLQLQFRETRRSWIIRFNDQVRKASYESRLGDIENKRIVYSSSGEDGATLALEAVIVSQSHSNARAVVVGASRKAQATKRAIIANRVSMTGNCSTSRVMLTPPDSVGN